jgi:hypothetical protein
MRTINQGTLHSGTELAPADDQDRRDSGPERNKRTVGWRRLKTPTSSQEDPAYIRI